MSRLIFGIRRFVAFGAVVLGASYGLLVRFVFGVGVVAQWADVMMVTFLFVVPLVVGFLTVYAHPTPVEEWRGGTSIVMPWVSALLAVAASLLLAWEGIICIVVWLPLFFVLGSVGGVIAGLVRRHGERPRPLVLVSVAIIPFVLAPLESRLPTPVMGRTVENTIVIEADPATVWAEIREVPAIAPGELGPSFAHRIGFPRPIEARLEGTGVGSVRYASFEGGVVFVERVTEWDEDRALAFTIDAGAVPPTTFDTHVAVGGPYFDVLTGRYVIEPLGEHRVRLHLASTHRLSTRFNAYTRLWTDLFMRDIQQNILEVIRARAERGAE
ncbi:MAG TPA: hypothetical protein VK610_02540 [Rhodothermales bacterium]|nr:hypothetical protein [Rhodothermales bacterium]